MVDLDYNVADEELVEFLSKSGRRLRSLAVDYHYEHAPDYSNPKIQLISVIAANCAPLRVLKLGGRKEVEPSADLVNVFKALSHLRHLEISSSMLSVEEVVSIGHFGALTQLRMCNIAGLTDEMLCALAPKLPLLEAAEIVFNDDVSHVGVNAFVRQANALTQLRVHGNELLHAEDVVAAVAANTTLCSRITDLSISPCLGVVEPETLRALGMKCFQLGYFSIPAPPEAYSEEILRLFRWIALEPAASDD